MSKNKEKKGNKRRWIIGSALVIVALCAAGGYTIFQRGQAMRAEFESAGTGDIVTAFIGDLSASASASGQVVAQREARLTAAGSGTITAVYVSVGDHVAAGEPLLQLDSAQLARSAASAQQSLIIQQSNLESAQAPPSAAELAAAEASVASAQAALDSILSGASQEEIAAAEADVRAAQADASSAASRLNRLAAGPSDAELQAAQLELQMAQTAATEAAQQHSSILVTEPGGFLSADRLASMEEMARAGALQANSRLEAAQSALDTVVNGDGDSIAAARAGVTSANVQLQIAQIQLDNLISPASEAQIAAARSSLAQAQANLDRLTRGPSQTQLEMAQIAVEQATIALAQAEIRLAQATLTAPFDGVITAVYAQQGEQAGGPLMEIVDDHSLQVKLLVDEIDLADLAPGQPATITLETWPDAALDSEVGAIAPAAVADNSALVTFELYLTLPETDLPVLAGMTANADLITSQKDGVLLLANAAIIADRENGTYSVNLVSRDGDNQISFTETPVTIGLRDGSFTQIISGLNAGDEILVGNLPPLMRFGRPGQDGPPQGGGPFG